jgi:hypothetical protein
MVRGQPVSSSAPTGLDKRRKVFVRRDENKTLVSTESEEFPLLLFSVIEIELPLTEDGTSPCQTKVSPIGSRFFTPKRCASWILLPTVG